MVRTRLDARGRITIPAKLREELGLRPGDEVTIEQSGARLILEHVAPEIVTVDSRGGWRRKPFLTAKEAIGQP